MLAVRLTRRPAVAGRCHSGSTRGGGWGVTPEASGTARPSWVMPPGATPAHTVSRSTGAREPGAAGGGAAAPLHPSPLAQWVCLACGGNAHAGQNVRGRGEAEGAPPRCNCG